MTQPPLSGGGGHGNRPMRAILPPITQQQFDQFSHLNTDETVRRVSSIYSLNIFKIYKINKDRNKLFNQSKLKLMISDQRNSLSVFDKSTTFR